MNRLLHNQYTRHLQVLVQTLALGIAPCVANAQPLISNFDSSTEGWTVETYTNPADSFSFVATYTPDHTISGGSPDGYISELDPDSNWSFFRAPPAWSGDRSGYVGGWLHYSTRTDTNNYPDGRLVILVGNNGQYISTDLGTPPINTWTTRQVRLLEGSWHTGTDASGSLATQAQIDTVLANLEALFIGLEFGGDLLEERVDLDSVQLSNCIADINADGALNFFDVSAFLGAFSAGDPAGDFNNDGDFNFFDVSEFLQAFAAGCP